MADKVRVGIVGLGGQGLAYADLIADGLIPDMALGAAFDVDLAKEQVAKSKYPGLALTPITATCFRAAMSRR